MTQKINLLLSGRKISFADENSRNINVVSDNDCFYVKLNSEEALPLAVFARFIKEGNIITDVLLDGDGGCFVPVNMLVSGSFEVGFYSSNFATTTLRIKVLSSVVFKDGIFDNVVTPSQTQQLIDLVNSVPVISEAYVSDYGYLMLIFSDGTERITGKVIGPEGDRGEKGDKGDKGDTGEKGEKGDKGDKGDSYILTERNKEEIAELSAGLIDLTLLDILGTGVIE